ncbi:DUF5709 domain-containing protein [Nocardioides marinquilinus]|uniref:DUF5709 domain-containing protein n=1 Tax=Nocardioides marinquilinus TaxID=1210400 RepID=A0ABP9PMF4_9ACTN
MSEYGTYSTDDEDQMPAEDTLGTDGGPGDVDDELDRGYSPPERWSAAQGFGNTPYEEATGETLEQRLAQEQPEPDELGAAEAELDEVRAHPGTAADTALLTGIDEQDELREVGDERAGRLVAPDQGLTEDTEKDLVGDDVGIDGAAASAEEAAVHVIPDDEV